MLGKERWNYSHWNGTHVFCGSEGRPKIHASGQSTTLLKTYKGGRGTNICLSEVSWILLPGPCAHPNSPTMEMLSLPFRCEKTGSGPCMWTPMQSPPEYQGLGMLNGTGSYKACSQGPHWGHCPSPPGWCMSHLGTSITVDAFLPGSLCVALRRYFLSESQALTCLSHANMVNCRLGVVIRDRQYLWSMNYVKWYKKQIKWIWSHPHWLESLKWLVNWCLHVEIPQATGWSGFVQRWFCVAFPHASDYLELT